MREMSPDSAGNLPFPNQTGELDQSVGAMQHSNRLTTSPLENRPPHGREAHDFLQKVPVWQVVHGPDVDNPSERRHFAEMFEQRSSNEAKPDEVGFSAQLVARFH